MSNSQLPQPINYIADEWSECATIPDAWNLDPNTRQPVHRAVTTSPDDVERALRHAERSYGFERWDDAASEERAAVIERAADIVETRIEDIARHRRPHQRRPDREGPDGRAVPAAPDPLVRQRICAPSRAAPRWRPVAATCGCTRSRGVPRRSSPRGTAPASSPPRRW